jgi:hypothetical protein
VGKPEGDLWGGLGANGKDNIKIDLREEVLGRVDSIDLARNRYL